MPTTIEALIITATIWQMNLAFLFILKPQEDYIMQQWELWQSILIVKMHILCLSDVQFATEFKWMLYFGWTSVREGIGIQFQIWNAFLNSWNWNLECISKFLELKYGMHSSIPGIDIRNTFWLWQIGIGIGIGKKKH